MFFRIHLSLLNGNKTELFTQLPGLGGAIRLTKYNTLLVPFVAVFPVSSTVMSFLGKFNLFRSIVGFVIYDIDQLYQNLLMLYFSLKKNKILAPNQIFDMWTKYGLIAEFDMTGKALRTWHDPSATRVSLATSAVLHNNRIYLGSYSSEFIAVVDY